jgi:RHS repeat-associated protein
MSDLKSKARFALFASLLSLLFLACSGDGNGGGPGNTGDAGPPLGDGAVEGATPCDCTSLTCQNPPPLDPTVVATLYNESHFIWAGVPGSYCASTPLQSGVAPTTIDQSHVAVLRGNVLDTNGKPLTGVTLSVVGHTEFGQTVSRPEGGFDLVVNGGQQLTVRYVKPGYVSVQRHILTVWNQYAHLPDVVMLPASATTSAVTLGATSTLADGVATTDSDGTRTPHVYIAPNTTANVVAANGTKTALSSFHLRMTELTSGTTGQQSMPADLPPASAYTYCTAFDVDEAPDAVRVDLSPPAVAYVDNFLSFATGTGVPAGAYVPASDTWEAGTNGVTLKVLSISSGKASVDADGDGFADSAAQLTALGITSDELTSIGGKFTAGASFWRVPLAHFSFWDFNLGYSPPDGAAASNSNANNQNKNNCSSPTGGSIIHCESQGLGEVTPLTGTGLSLMYSSERTRAYAPSRTVDIQLSDSTLPAIAKKITMQVDVAGQRFTQDFPATPNLSTTFTWDGNDAYGRPLQGVQSMLITIDTYYDAVYELTDQFGYIGTGQTIVTDRNQPANTRAQVALETLVKTNVTGWDERGLGDDGWTLDAHNVFDPNTNTIFFGTGDKQDVETLGTSVTSIAGLRGLHTSSGDGGPATQATMNYPHGLVVTPEGVAYVSDEQGHSIRKIDTSGIITTIAGNGSPGFAGDGGPAVNAQLQDPMGLALGSDGSLYIADSSNFRVRKIAPDGTMSTVAGNGTFASTGDGGAATSATFMQPHALAFGPDGSLYVTDGIACTIRRISASGIISPFAGNGTCAYAGDGGPATKASITSPTGIAFAVDGTTYVAERNNFTIRKIDPSGIISTYAGTAGSSGYTGDGGPATLALLGAPHTVDVGNDGNVYFTDEGNDVVRRIDSTGAISTVAGGGTSDASGIPALASDFALPRVIYINKDGSIWVADYLAQEIKRFAIPRPLSFNGNYVIPTPDGKMAYIFDINGRHLKTIDTVTGIAALTFNYDAAGRVASVVDRDGNTTTLTRDASGCLTSVLSPWGHTTTLACDANGFLGSATDPANAKTSFISDANGLLQSRAAPNGDTNTFTFDAQGRLTKDAEPWGGYKTLTRSTLTNGWSVAVTTAQGRVTGHDYVTDSVKGETRTMHLPDGNTASFNRAPSQTVNVKYENGGTLQTTATGDPRFDMMAPIDPAGSYTTPLGNAVTMSQSRAVTLGASGDPTAPATYSETATLGGNGWTRAYDATSRTWVITSPTGRTQQVALDAKGHVIEVDSPNRAPVRASYDTKGRLSTITQDTRMRGVTYDANSNVATSTDPLSHTWSYAYDPVGRTTGVTRADSQKIGISYDVNGNVLSITPPGKTAHDFTYTAGDVPQAYKPPTASGTGANNTTYAFSQDLDLSSLTRADSQSVSFGYDAAGRLSSTTSSVGVASLSYGATTGELTGVADPNGESTAIATDGNLLTGITWSGAVAGSLGLQYDSVLRVSQETAGGSAIAYGYDDDNLVTSAGSETISRNRADGYLSGTSIGAASDAFSFSEYGELATYAASISGTAVFTQNFTRDALGRVSSLQETIDGATHTYSYTYDLADRLATVTIDGAAASSYTYDGNGNATSATVRGVAATGSYDAQDRVTSYGGATFDWTAQGELQGKHLGGSTTTYASDSLGRLQSVTLPTGHFVSYVYDGSNRRVGKKVDGVLQQGFLYRDAIKPVVELDGAGNVVSRFVYGTNPITPDYVIKGGNTYKIFADQIGSPRVVVDVSSGSVVERIDYDERGNTLRDTNAGFIPFGFAGGIVDRDTGLIRFGARDYDPSVGRWTQKDSAGFNGGLNFYVYAGNDAVNWVDPSGHDPLVLIGAVVGASADLAWQLAGNGGNLSCVNWGEVAGAGLIGAALGFALPIVADGAFLADEAGVLRIGGRGYLSEDAVFLSKQLASEAQLGEMSAGEGEAFAGAGTDVEFRDAARIASTYGGEAGDWAKMTSSGFQAADGTTFATHWVQNVVTGDQVEAKVVIDIFGK